MSDNRNVKTWEKLLENIPDFIGRDLEISEGRHIFRGPIETIMDNKDSIDFIMKWCAEDLAGGCWKEANAFKDASINYHECSLSVLKNGAMQWSLPYLGTFTIHPEGINLDPSKVIGLNLKK